MYFIIAKQFTTLNYIFERVSAYTRIVMIDAHSPQAYSTLFGVRYGTHAVMTSDAYKIYRFLLRVFDISDVIHVRLLELDPDMG